MIAVAARGEADESPDRSSFGRSATVSTVARSSCGSFAACVTDLCQTGEAGSKVQQATKNDDSHHATWAAFIRQDVARRAAAALQRRSFGSMSLVGPRPHATAHNEEYRGLIDGYMLRHKVKPGITGLAQVRGFRGETETLDKMQGRVHFDHEYIRRWSLWMDIKILFQTVGVVLRQENAY